MKEPNMFHNYETEKITRKASDVAENLQLYPVLTPKIVMHNDDACYSLNVRRYMRHA